MSEHKHNDNCDCGCDHDHEEATVTLTLDDDTELECAVLAVFPAGELEYIALMPIEDGEDDDEAEVGDIYLYRFKELENGEVQLDNIEDDDEYELVSDAFDELIDSEEFDELLEDVEELEEEFDEE